MTFYMVELRVADVAHAVTWYEAILGLHVVLRDGPEFALLQGTGLRLALKAGTPVIGGATLYWQVSALPDLCTRLAQQGIAVGEMAVSAEGYRRVFLSDPDGYRVGLFEWVS